MNPVEFAICVRFEKMAEMLKGISDSSMFDLKLDPYEKFGKKRETYRILLYNTTQEDPEVIGLLEAAQTQKAVTTIKIHERYSTTLTKIPATGSPLTRFISLFAQTMLLQGLIPRD